MKKSLVAMAIVGAFSAPAMADVTISGAINVGPAWGRISDGTATGTSNSINAGDNANKGFSNAGLTSNYSNINITSTDDLGGGNKLVFNYSLDVSNTGSTVHDVAGNAKSRNTNLQFQGSWGSFGMGINEHIYERYQYTSDVLDGAVGIGGNLQMLGTVGGNVFDNGNSSCSNTTAGGANGCMEFYRRQGHSLFFDSANYGGLTFGVALSLNAYKGGTTDRTQPRFWSAGVKFAPEGGPFFIDAAIERHLDMYGMTAIAGGNSINGTSSTDTGFQLGGGVMFGNISVNLRFERLSYSTDGLVAGSVSDYERDAVWAGVKFGLSSGYAGLQVGVADDGDCELTGGGSCNASDTGAVMVTGGYFHNLTNQTQLQFLFSVTRNDALANYLNIGSPTTWEGGDGTSLGFGVKHVF